MSAQDKVSSKAAAETPAEPPVDSIVSDELSPESEPMEPPTEESAPVEYKVTKTHAGYVCVSSINHDNVLYGVGVEFPKNIASPEQFEQLLSSGALKLADIEGA